MSQTVLLSAKRTPIGSFQGSLSKIPAPKLGGVAIASAIEAAGVSKDDIQEVIMGNVL